jgi:hypothetical protein
VAKSRFRTAAHAVPVVRGSSLRPLFVTAAGMPRTNAADLVRRVAGRHRLPDALRRADILVRGGPPAVSMTGRQPTDLRTRAERGIMRAIRLPWCRRRLLRTGPVIGLASPAAAAMMGL